MLVDPFHDSQEKLVWHLLGLEENSQILDQLDGRP